MAVRKKHVEKIGKGTSRKSKAVCSTGFQSSQRSSISGPAVIPWCEMPKRCQVQSTSLVQSRDNGKRVFDHRFIELVLLLLCGR